MKRILDRIRTMERMNKICIYFDEFINTRSLNNYIPVLHRVLRKGIKYDEQVSFVEFLMTKEFFKSYDKDLLFDWIHDAIEDGFLREDLNLKAEGTSYHFNLISLGIKGRKLIRGNWLENKAYYWEFIFSERSNLYNSFIALIIGIGLGFIVQNLFNIGTYLFHMIQLVHG